jgi:shikimate kinase
VILKLKRTPGIYIVGFMASGKSTVGRMLADRIGWRFVDLDDDIETQQSSTIPKLFETLGEEEFRRIESEAIRLRVRKIQAGHPTVIAPGGGVFTRAENIDLLLNNGIVIWLDTAYSILKRRAEGSSHRPLARDPARFQELYEARKAFYAQADYRIELNEDNSRVAVEQILALPLFE